MASYLKVKEHQTFLREQVRMMTAMKAMFNN